MITKIKQYEEAFKLKTGYLYEDTDCLFGDVILIKIDKDIINHKVYVCLFSLEDNCKINLSYHHFKKYYKIYD